MSVNVEPAPSPTPPAAVPALEVRGLVKHYPGVTALDGVDLVVRPHEVLGLAGENGAGKSTLLKALVGLVRPDAGEIWVRGEKVRLKSVVDAADHGIGMVFQEQSLVPNLTAAENIVLGAEGLGVRRGRLGRTAEDAFRSGQELFLPAVDQRRVDAVVPDQFVDRPVPLEGSQGDLGLERRRMDLPLACHQTPFAGPPE